MTEPKTEKRPRTSNEPDDPLVRLCRSLPGATEDVKWGDNLIFSVGGKMFAGFDLPELQPLSFKVDPVAFQTLVASPAFAPAPYMARNHWVTVTDRELVPIEMLEELLIEAHALVASKLSRKARQAPGYWARRRRLKSVARRRVDQSTQGSTSFNPRSSKWRRLRVARVALRAVAMPAI